MATDEDVAAVRRMAAEPGTETYSNDAISALVDAKGSREAAASAIWSEKASGLATLVNTSESGSSRSLGDLYKNAQSMANFYANQVKEETAAETPDYPFSTAITRG